MCQSASVLFLPKKWGINSLQMIDFSLAYIVRLPSFSFGGKHVPFQMIFVMTTYVCYWFTAASIDNHGDPFFHESVFLWYMNFGYFFTNRSTKISSTYYHFDVSHESKLWCEFSSNWWNNQIDFDCLEKYPYRGSKTNHLSKIARRCRICSSNMFLSL